MNLKQRRTVARSGISITSANSVRSGAVAASPSKWQYARRLALSDLVAVIAAIGTAHLIRFGSSSSNPTAALLRGITYTQISIAIA